MTAAQCCKRRLTKAAAPTLPGILLLLLPKCPLCLAAWIALATGIGISATAASYLREGVIAVCIAMFIAVMASEVGRRMIERR